MAVPGHAFVTERSTGGVGFDKVVVHVAVLFPDTGSITAPPMVTESETLLPTNPLGTVTTTVIVAVEPERGVGCIKPRSQCITLFSAVIGVPEARVLHVPRLVVAETKVVPIGSVSSMNTFVAVSGPLFVAVIV